MNKGRKELEEAVFAYENGNLRQAVFRFKRVLNYSFKRKRTLKYSFKALLHLADIYNETGCAREAEELYKMAANVDQQAKYLILGEKIKHRTLKHETDNGIWLKKNMIDGTDILKSYDGKHWEGIQE